VERELSKKCRTTSTSENIREFSLISVTKNNNEKYLNNEVIGKMHISN